MTEEHHHPNKTMVEEEEKPSSKTSQRSEDVETPQHQLNSFQPGESEVEQIAERAETMRARRVPVTFEARVRFLEDCRVLTRRAGRRVARLSRDEVCEYRERILAERDDRQSGLWTALHRRLGLLSDLDCLVQMCDRAVDVLTRKDLRWLYYQDFNVDHTVTVSRHPVLRSELRTACLILFLYYLFTPILFCVILDEDGICEGMDGDSTKYRGWVSALYFASTTMSTVGYGDLTVDQEPRYMSFIGTMYMILSMYVAVVAFSAAASASLSPIEALFDKVFVAWKGDHRDDMFLHERIRRLRFVRLTELIMEILTFVAIGVFAARIAILFEEEEDKKWTWMTSFYWAVQTTTTIGYGDLTPPFGLRYFKIAYLMFSTVIVGNAFGKLGSLKQELTEIRRQHAWNRRKVTERWIDEMQAYNNDGQVDQYEFLVSSLISLNKIGSDDIRPVMDKFRLLAGPKGFITQDDVVTDEAIDNEGSQDIREDALVGSSGAQ